jgi:tetratricopeptide (TPR) repeat protein
MPVKLTGGGFTQHEADLYSTLKINEEVFAEEPRLRDILDLLTWSGTAPMGISLMCKLLDVDGPVELTGALGLGVSLRMLQKSPDAESYSIHRLLSEVRREEIPLDGRKEWANQMCKRIGDWFQERRKDFSNLPMLEAEIDHLKAWQAQAPKYALEQTSRLIWLESYPHYHRGRFREAKALIEDALRSFGLSHTKDDEFKANLLNDLGRCHHHLLEYQIALSYYESALEIRQSTFGERHAGTADSLNDIAMAYSDQKDYARGVEYSKRALDIRLNIFGERNTDTAMSYRNTGICYEGLGEHKQAQEHAEKGLNLVLELQGERHPDTAHALGIIGSIYNNIGDFKHAQEYVQKALKLNRELLGDQHRYTINATISMVTIFCNLNRPRQGLQLIEEMLRKVPQDNPSYDRLKQKHPWVRSRVPGLRLQSTSGHNKKKKKKRH